MKNLIIIFALIAQIGFSQEQECFCSQDSFMNSTLTCDTTILENGARLYWQHNCDSIWLTFESEEGLKQKLNEIPVELYGYRYRLGFYLSEEFDKQLLFRSGCPANGPCSYTLISKKNGELIKEFHELIRAEIDNYPFDFLVYLSYETDEICVYHINQNEIVKTKFKDKLTGIIPEYQFQEMKVINENELELTYEQDEEIRTVIVNLKK